MKLFEKIVALDRAINEAFDDGNEAKADELYEQQESLVDEVERLGLRKEFDKYIMAMN